jgi:antitoxin component YwqK of YwqJK toxin-antitoxin module
MKAFIQYYGYIFTVLVDDLTPVETPVVNPDFARYSVSLPVIITQIYHLQTKQYVEKVFKYDIDREKYIHKKKYGIGKTFNNEYFAIYKTKKAARSAAKDLLSWQHGYTVKSAFIILSGWWTTYLPNGGFYSKVYYNPKHNIVDTRRYIKLIYPMEYNNLLVKHDFVRNLTTITTSNGEVVKKYDGIVKFYYKSIDIRSVENYKNSICNGFTKEFNRDGSVHSVTCYKNNKCSGPHYDDVYNKKIYDFILYDRGWTVSSQIISIYHQIRCILFKKTRFKIL